MEIVSPLSISSYALMQTIAAKQNFHVAMIYDETNQEDGATDEAIADFNMFHDTYLSPKAPGSQATLTYAGRPVIFIFPREDTPTGTKCGRWLTSGTLRPAHLTRTRSRPICQRVRRLLRLGKPWGKRVGRGWQQLGRAILERLLSDHGVEIS